MIRAVIIDDELSGRKILSQLVERHLDEVEVVGTAGSVLEGKELIEESRPELVFLDIDMKDGTGFDLLDSIVFRDFGLIFVTAYSEFALKAFQFYAIGYLLKPVNVSELKAVVMEAIQRRGKGSGGENSQMEVLRELLNQDRPVNRRIGLPSQNGIQFVKISSILWCKANESYTEVHLENGKKILVSKKLIEVEELLKDLDFFRIHRTYLINLEHLQSYVRGNGGHVILSNGIKLDVSRRKKEEFLNRIKTLR